MHKKLDGSKRFGPRTYPHVEISSKFEVLGPRNGRGPTSSKPLKVKVVFSGYGFPSGEFRKIEVYCIDFSRPSPVSKFAGAGILTKRGLRGSSACSRRSTWR